MDGSETAVKVTKQLKAAIERFRNG